MKKLLLSMSVLLAASITSYAQDQYTPPAAPEKYTPAQKPLVLHMDINKPSAQWPGELFDFSVAARRADKSQPVTVQFPRYGAQASIRLYADSAYYNRRNDASFVALAIDHVKNEQKDQPLSVDLSHLHDGDYVAIYSSGNRNEAIKISLTSE